MRPPLAWVLATIGLRSTTSERPLATDRLSAISHRAECANLVPQGDLSAGVSVEWQLLMRAEPLDDLVDAHWKRQHPHFQGVTRRPARTDRAKICVGRYLLVC